MGALICRFIGAWLAGRRPCLLLVLVLSSTPCGAGQTAVELQIVSVKGVQATSQHQWARALQALPFESVRISPGGDRQPSLQVVGTGVGKFYRVTGILTPRNELLLPGGQFQLHDQVGISSWLQKIGELAGDEQPTHAFGLTAQKLLEITQGLEVALPQATKNQTARSVLRSVRDLIEPQLTLSPLARKKLSPGEEVRDELKGISAGTAAAAVLRPLGLVLVPKSQNGEIVLMIQDVSESPEHWPIGWPREQNPQELVPKWLDFLEVEIEDVTLDAALALIQSRLEIPFLWDHNGLARERIDPTQTRVSFPAKKTFYARILKNLLFQARLQGEIRADEAGHPLLWISPISPGPGR